MESPDINPCMFVQLIVAKVQDIQWEESFQQMLIGKLDSQTEKHEAGPVP